MMRIARVNHPYNLVDTVTQVAVLARLIALFPVVIGLGQLPDRGHAMAVAVGCIVVAIIGFAGLMSRATRDFLRDHPSLVLADALLLAFVAWTAGSTAPFILTFMSSALAVGLLAAPWAGSLIMVSLLGLYLLVLHNPHTGSPQELFLIPFVLVTLWGLGIAVRRASDAEIRSRRALHSAITVAAATEERHRIARDMHDTLAKSLQSMSLTASVLPRLIAANPGRASEHAHDLHETSVSAIDEVRALMTALRREVAEGPLHEVVEQVATDWSERTGISHKLTVLGDGAVTDGLVRYELLMVLTEALENVSRHAQAHEVRIRLDTAAELVTLSVRDDGVGAAATRLEEAAAEQRFGVQGMGERLHKVGGSLAWESAPGAGTTVTAQAHPAGLIEESIKEGA